MVKKAHVLPICYAGTELLAPLPHGQALTCELHNRPLPKPTSIRAKPTSFSRQVSPCWHILPPNSAGRPNRSLPLGYCMKLGKISARFDRYSFCFFLGRRKVCLHSKLPTG